MNITFYLYLKSHGRSVKSHPVVKQLLELRYAMEKLRPIDAKLQHQVDRLVKLAYGESGSDLKNAALRPNLFALDDDSDDEDEDGEDHTSRNKSNNKRNKKSKAKDSDEDSEIEDDMEPELNAEAEEEQLYKAPKMIATPYKVRLLVIN
jgi:hypothetical protein